MRRARYLTTGFLALEPKAFGVEFDAKVEVDPFEMVGHVAVICVTGPLDQHPSWCFQDYDTLRAQAQLAFEDGQVRAVALRINSPGGAAAGCFELSRALRAMSEESDKPLGVFVDGMAASAAYALASSATPGCLHAPPTSTVASLAVYEMQVDQTAADAAMGVRFIFTPSTGADLKLTGNAHVAPSEAMLAHTQAQVDLLTDYFYSLVSEMRGIPVADIAGLRGATLLASQGLTEGLVDSLSDWDTFISSVATAKVVKGSPQMPAQAKAKSPFGDALAALTEAANGDEGDEREAARKMLAAHYGADDKNDDPPPADKKEPEAAAPTEPTEEEKKAKAEADEKAKAASAGAPAAQARAHVEVDLGRVVQEQNVKIESMQRDALLAQRPDFSAEVRKSLAKASIAVVEDAVKSWPRVVASAGSATTPSAAAAAATPGATPGKADNAQKMSAEEQAILDRWTHKPGAAQAKMEGASLVLEHMTHAAAAERMKQLQSEGFSPPGRTTPVSTLESMSTKAVPR